METPSFEFVEEQMRKKDFGFLTVIDSKNRPHTTGILYGLAPKEQPFAVYILTGKNYMKTKYASKNPNVSFAIPFPHYWLRFVPSNTVQFQGTAEILPLTDEIAIETFQSRKMLKMNLESDYEGEMVFIRITPRKKIWVFGLGYSVMDMRSDHTAGSYTVYVPGDRM